MAAQTDVTLTNRKTSKDFLFRGVTDWKVKKDQPVTSIPFVNTTPSSTILFRFFGQTEKVSFNFVIFDDGTDVSNGTEPGGIRTVTEQIAYLKDTVYGDDFDVSWDVQQTKFYASAVEVVVTALDIDDKGGRPSFVTGSIAMQRGTIGAV